MQLLNGEARAMRNYIDGVDHELSFGDKFPIKTTLLHGDLLF